MADPMTALPEVLEKLEPCPFCSGEAVDRPVSPQFWTVSCTQCQTEGPPFPSQSEAITAWNTRPALLRDAGDGERLRDLHSSIRIVYEAVPSLPITFDSMDAATDVLHAFCLLVGIHQVDVGDPQPPAMHAPGGAGEP